MGKVGRISEGKGKEDKRKWSDAMDLTLLRRRKPSNAEELERMIYQYFQTCVDRDEAPTKPGLALALGYSSQDSLRGSMGKWETALDNPDSIERFHAMKKAHHFIEQVYNLHAAEGRPGSYFLLKTSYGYDDRGGQGKAQNEPNSSATLNFGALMSSDNSSEDGSQDGDDSKSLKVSSGSEGLLKVGEK